MEYRFDITCWVTLVTGERHRIASGESINGKLLESGNLASCLQQQYCKEVPAPPKTTPQSVGAKKNQAAPQQ